MTKDLPKGEKGSLLVREQVYKKILSLIKESLQPGERLPAVRQVAKEEGVARVSVEAAYSRLQNEGIIEIQPRQGAFVKARHTPVKRKLVPIKYDTKHLSLLSDKLEILKKASLFRPQNPVPFAISYPNYKLLYQRQHQQVVSRFTKNPRITASYTLPGGDIEFRKLIANRLRRTRGIYVDPDQIIITTGSQQGLILTLRVIFNPEENCMVENPCSPLHWLAVEALGIHAIPVSVDSFGICVPDCKSKNVKGILTSPSVQYPLGITTTLARRREIVRWATAAGCWIIEYDRDSEFLSSPVSSYLSLMAAAGKSQSVIYLGTYSDTKYPAVKLGFLICPKFLIETFKRAKQLSDHDVDISHQRILAEDMKSGVWESHLRQVNRIFTERRKALLNALQKELSDWGSIGDSKGLALVFYLKPNLLDTKVEQFLRETAGIETLALSPLYLPGTKSCNGLLLGFIGYSCDEIHDAAKKLRKAMEEFNRKG